jgi:hypothetical protein
MSLEVARVRPPILDGLARRANRSPATLSSRDTIEFGRFFDTKAALCHEYPVPYS